VNRWNRVLRPALNPTCEAIAPGDMLVVTENHRRSGLVNGERVRVLQVGALHTLPGPGARIQVREVRLEAWGPSGCEQHSLTLMQSHLWEPARELPGGLRQRLWQHVLATYPVVRAALKSRDRAAQKAAMQVIDEDPFFGSLRAKPGYALTTHRAQGGEWRHVIVDCRGIRPSSTEDLRWAYTAVTRASGQARLIDPPLWAGTAAPRPLEPREAAVPGLDLAGCPFPLPA